MDRSNHLERDALAMIRKKRLRAEKEARAEVAREIGLLPAHQRKKKESQGITIKEKETYRTIPPIKIDGTIYPQVTYGSVSKNPIVLIAGIGLVMILIAFALFNMQHILGLPTLPTKEIIREVHHNVTIEKDPIIVTQTKEIEIIKTEDAPLLDYRGTMWCNGEGRCYPTQR